MLSHFLGFEFRVLGLGDIGALWGNIRVMLGLYWDNENKWNQLYDSMLCWVEGGTMARET